jgi:hypothetical protein
MSAIQISNFNKNIPMGIGDWGLGPIPNPQSPIPINLKRLFKKFFINLINLI